MELEKLIENFLNVSRGHDWDYSYSDDHGVWRKGDSHRKSMWAAFKAIDAVDPVAALETWNKIAPANHRLSA